MPLRAAEPTGHMHITGVAKMLACVFGFPALGAGLAVSLIDVGGWEHNVAALVTILTFTIPLVASVTMLAITYYNKVEQAWVTSHDLKEQVAVNRERIVAAETTATVAKEAADQVTTRVTTLENGGPPH